jgi:hypothetical protein
VFGPRRLLGSEELKEALGRLPDDFEPLVQAATRLAEEGAWREAGDGPVLIGHRPDIAPLAYDVALFPALDVEQLRDAEARLGRGLPRLLADLLLTLNGAHVFELNIYGIPPDSPLADRSVRAPLDLGRSNRWRQAYAAAPEEAMLFASRNVSDQGQIGYFLTPDGSILGRGNRARGAPSDSGAWTGLRTWIEAVLASPRPAP